jgi:hypothetical protein
MIRAGEIAVAGFTYAAAITEGQHPASIAVHDFIVQRSVDDQKA